MGRDPVRMGSKTVLASYKIPIIIAFFLCATSVAAFLFWKISHSSESKKYGCEINSDCKEGSMCAKGGCLIMLSSENKNLWHDEIEEQLMPSSKWKPLAAFGEKIIPTPMCPAKLVETNNSDVNHLVPLKAVFLYEVAKDVVKITHQRRVKGRKWVDSLRFWFPKELEIAPQRICASQSVDSISVTKGRLLDRDGSTVTVTLLQSVPVGAIAAGAVSVDVPLPLKDDKNIRILDFLMEPVHEPGATATSVVTLPLGSEVVSIEGPPPTYQRLLTGHIAYYWKHGEEISEITIRFRMPNGEIGKLNKSELNP